MDVEDLARGATITDLPPAGGRGCSCSLHVKLKRMTFLTIPTLILSCACIIVGILSIWSSAPYYKAPYYIGGALFTGLASLCIAASHMYFYRMYINNGRRHIDVKPFQNWTIVTFFAWGFVILGFIAGVLVSGVGGLIAARNILKSTDAPPMYTSLTYSEYGRRNQQYAIATLVLSLLLSLFMTFVKWIETSYTWAYKSSRPDHYRHVVTPSSTWLYSPTGFNTTDSFSTIPVPNHSPRQIMYDINSNNQDSSQTSHTAPAVQTTSSDYNRERVPRALISSRDAPSERVNGTLPSTRGHRNINLSIINTTTNNMGNYSTSTSAGGTYPDMSRGHTPPPRYSLACETPPPTYSDITKYRAFRVDRV